MPKASKFAFYGVHKGHKPGIYMSRADCEEQVKGYPNAKYKKFASEADARAFVESGVTLSNVTVAAATGGGSSSATRSRLVAPAQAESSIHKTKQSAKQNAGDFDIRDESGWDVVYTDGACQGNGKEGAVAGIGVWWGVDDPRNLAERCPGDQTNNRAELIAIVRALETAPHAKPLLIKTDSSYSISCIRDWLSSWRRNGWKTAKKKDVKNKAVITYLSELLDQRGQKGQRVEFQHVRGHIGIPGNEGADELARFGSFMPAKPEEHWSLTKEDPKDTKDGTAEDFQASLCSKYFQTRGRTGRVVALRPTAMQIDEDDILSTEELNRMAAEGKFD